MADTSTKLRSTVVGFAAAIAVFALLFYYVGVGDLVQQLSRADPRVVALVVAMTLGWLAAWGLALRAVLDVLGVDISEVRAFLVFSGAMFSNNVTPFGQAGGEPVTALLIAESSDAEYETGLAAIASVDTLNFVPSITLAIIGVGYFATETTLGRNLEIAAGAVFVLALAVPALVYLAWKHRYGLEHRVVRTVTPFLQRIARVVPRVSPPDPSGIERRVGRFFHAIERVATNRRGLAIALGLSALGWACQMTGLWLAFQAIGVSISLSITFFVVPMAAIAGITPLPGGAGGIESVLVVLLLAATGPAVTESMILAAVIIFRGAVYWTPVVIGGTVMSVVGAHRRI